MLACEPVSVCQGVIPVCIDTKQLYMLKAIESIRPEQKKHAKSIRSAHFVSICAPMYCRKPLLFCGTSSIASLSVVMIKLFFVVAILESPSSHFSDRT